VRSSSWSSFSGRRRSLTSSSDSSKR